MGLVNISFGSDPAYLTRHAEEGLQRTADGRSPEPDQTEVPGPDRATRERRREGVDYYLRGTEHGEPPGRWAGQGAEALRLTGQIDNETFRKLYGTFRHPETGEQLGSAPYRYKTKDQILGELVDAEAAPPTPERRRELLTEATKRARTPVNYVDVTYSPTKSWSVLQGALEHAGRYDQADKVEEAIQAAVDAGLGYIVKEGLYVRTGHHSGRGESSGPRSGKWEKASGLVVGIFIHHLSRDGDPQLHIHIAMLNRVLCEDGKWRAIDGDSLNEIKAALAAVMDRTAEARGARSLGVGFHTRPDGMGREIAGILQEVLDLGSSRTRAISRELEGALAEYRAANDGREPSQWYRSLMTKTATIKTRARKPDRLPGRAERAESFESRVREVLDGSLTDVLSRVGINPDAPPGRQLFDPARVIEQAIGDVQSRGAAWSRHQLISAIDRALPPEVKREEIPAFDTVLDELARAALSSGSVTTLEAPEVVPPPKSLQRDDGRSPFEPPHKERFAAIDHLGLEDTLVTAARSGGAARIPPDTTERLVRESRLVPEEGAQELPDQGQAALSVLSSGRRLEVLRGPAGTGKTFTVANIAELWKESTGGRVMGISVAQNAVEVLRAEGIERGVNVAKFLQAQRVIDKMGPERRAQGWFACTLDAYTVGPNDLIILDEAAKIPTPEMSAIIRRVLSQPGAKVLITGDENQTTAVGPGGGMRLIAKNAPVHELSEVRRFTQQWEREASLRLREGDIEVLHEYDRRGRLIEGSPEKVSAEARRGFLADYLAGRETVLLVGSNDKAAEQSSHIRRELQRLGLVEQGGVALKSQTHAGKGDLIQARQIDRSIVDATGREVINRDVFRVISRLPADDLVVERQLRSDERAHHGSDWGPRFTLPASYVSSHVELAYASTVDAAQGRSVKTGRLLVDPRMTRNTIYPGLTRGTDGNFAFIPNEVAREHETVATDKLTLMARLLEREDPERSATEIRDQNLAWAESLGRLGGRWREVVAEHEQQRSQDRDRQVTHGDW